MSGDDDDKAEALLRKSISLKADYWESHLELAKALEQKGRPGGRRTGIAAGDSS